MSERHATSVPDELRHAVARDLRPVRPLADPWRRALTVVPIAAVAMGMPFLYFRMRDIGEIGASLAWVPIAVQILLAFGLLALALREAIPGRQLSRTTLVGLCMAGFGLHAVANFAIYLRLPTPPHGSHFDAWLGCIQRESLIGLPVLFVVAWLAGRALPARPMLAGFLVGTGAGLAADSSWRLFCPVSIPGHVLLAHTGAVVALGLTGMLLGWVWDRVRERPAY